jgi:hypothetical protein
MKPWLVRLGLSLALLGFAACSDSSSKKQVQKTPDTSIKVDKPPAPPPLPKTPPPKPSKTR